MVVRTATPVDGNKISVTYPPQLMWTRYQLSTNLNYSQEKGNFLPISINVKKMSFAIFEWIQQEEE